MKILTKRQQLKILANLIATAKLIKLDTFDGEFNEQVEKFDKFVSQTIDTAYTIGGFMGLALLENELGISSNKSFTDNE